MWLPGSPVLICLLACSAIVVPAQSPRANSSNLKHDPVAAFEEGQNAHQRGDLNMAVTLYTTALTADPTLVLAYYQRAVALMDLHRGPEAEADLKRVIALQPGYARAYRGLGRVLLDQGKTDESKLAFARALELEPKLAGVRLDYASALIKSGDAAGAMGQLDTAISNGEGTALAYALLGVARERLGKLDEALAAYDRAIEMDSNSAAAREGRARLYEGQGEIAKAIADYTIAYRAVLSPEVALRLARLHARAGQVQAAIQIYRRLLLEREDFAVRIEMAKLMSENGQGEEAAREISGVLAVRPKDARLLMLAGEVHFKEKPELAADYYRRAVEAEPANNRARVQLGASLVRSLQFEAAIPVLTDAIATEPDNYQAHANLATARFKLKQYPQAAVEFIWIVRARPEIAASYYFLAISFDRLGDCSQALRAYQEFARRADPVTQKTDVEEANLRLGMLQRLAREGKCKPVDKGKGK